MATPYVENPVDVFNYATDWLETIGDKQDATAHFTEDIQENTRTGLIPWNKQRSALSYFIGYSYVDQTTFQLHRVNPQPDPVFPWLYCYDCSFQGWSPVPNPENVPTTGQAFPYVDSDFWDSTPPSNPIVPLRATQWEKAFTTLKYRSYKYQFQPDGNIPTPAFEWMRNCFFEPDNQLDVLQADGVGQLVFAEGGAGGNGPVAGTTAFPAAVPQLLPKANYTINWYSLPLEYVSLSPTIFLPAKILAGLGTVNSANFPTPLPGQNVLFPPFTGLMKAVKCTVYPLPIASSNVNLPLMGVHVQITVEYFNPPQGRIVPLSAGHLTFPWRGRPMDPTGGLFFYCTRGGNSTDPAYLQSYNFNNIFYNVNLPPF